MTTRGARGRRSILRRIRSIPILRPGTSAIVIVLVLGLAIAGLLRLRVDVDVSVLSGGPRDAAAALSEIESTFSSLEELIIVLTPAATDVASIEAAGGIAAVHAQLDRARDVLAAALEADAVLAELGARRTDEAADAAAAQRFFEQRVLPRMLWYLDDDAVAGLEARVSPDGAARQMRRTESAFLAPGPAGSAVAERLAQDPLQLFDFAVTLLPGADDPDGEANGDAAPRPDGALAPARPLARKIALQGGRPVSDSVAANALVQAVARVCDDVVPADISVRTTGAYAIATYSERAVKSDMLWGTVTSIILIAGLYLVLYRSPIAGLLAAIPVTGAIALAMGSVGWISGSISHLGTLSAAVLAGLAIDYALHGLSRWAARPPRHGLTGALSAWSSDLARPMTVSAITSAIGFTALALSPVVALSDFGRLGALGVLAAALATLFVLPVLLRRFPRATGRPRVRVDRLLARVIARPGRTLAIGLVAWAVWMGVAGFGGGPWLDRDITSMHPAPNPPLDLQKELPALFDVPAEQVLVLVRAPDEVALLERAHAVRERVRTPAAYDLGVRGSVGLADLVPRPRRTPADGPPTDLDAEVVAGTVRAVLEGGALDPAAFTAYPETVAAIVRPAPPLMPGDLRDEPAFAGRLTPSTGPVDRTLVLVEFDEPLLDAERRREAIEGLRALLADIGDRATAVTGFAAVAVDLETTTRRTLPPMLGGSALAILVLMIVVLRAPRRIVLVLTPAVLGVSALAVGMTLLGPGWNVLSFAALPLVVGLGVDDGVFVDAAVMGARDRRDLRRRLGPTGHAILSTTLTTMLGFGSLAVSSTPAVASLGLAVAMGAAFALAVTLFVQVPLAVLTSGVPARGHGRGHGGASERGSHGEAAVPQPAEAAS